ncbi:hypothetical protein VT84_13660 [Gemmata sp. SH-PL17]|uniref:hypothetical protein n=1 Tax=Gemmata sp. SH-PL17 TaxID=1630693 RepID=UPI00078B9806|nr:hypothetical protein [Gemmata sp. SH-PL17]AMV25443.1 hypothetical protein VT84_13660 [Gemmata sp. SH-PL17]
MPGDVVEGTGLSELPATQNSGYPFEIEALSPRERWGAGTGAASIVCRVPWETSADWIADMVGGVRVVRGSTLELQRALPEQLNYGDGRQMFCTGVEQLDMGGNAGDEPFSDAINCWPRADWIRYKAVFEVMPYKVRTLGEIDAMVAGAASVGFTGQAKELCRWVIRNRKGSVREQKLPLGASATAFAIEGSSVPGPPKPIPGEVGFKNVVYADVAYTWVRVPVGWPPPATWTAAGVGDPWPPPANAKIYNNGTFVADAAASEALKYARDAFLGSVNDDWFDVADPDGYAFAPGTLLYVSYDDNYKYDDAAGNQVMDVVYYFRYKAGGWNKFLNADGDLVTVTLGGVAGGTKVYSENDFNDLFQYRTAGI